MGVYGHACGKSKHLLHAVACAQQAPLGTARADHLEANRQATRRVTDRQAQRRAAGHSDRKGNGYPVDVGCRGLIGNRFNVAEFAGKRWYRYGGAE